MLIFIYIMGIHYYNLNTQLHLLLFIISEITQDLTLQNLDLAGSLQIKSTD